MLYIGFEVYSIIYHLLIFLLFFIVVCVMCVPLFMILEKSRILLFNIQYFHSPNDDDDACIICLLIYFCVC